MPSRDTRNGFAWSCDQRTHMIADVAILICPICGVRRETTVEAVCEHKWLCDGSAVLVL